VQPENLPWPFPRAGERGGPRRRVAGRSGCAQLGARAACAAAGGSRRRRNGAARRGAHATWGPPLPANPTTRHGNPLLSISMRAFCFSIYCGTNLARQQRQPAFKLLFYSFAQTLKECAVWN
jgi:hypothetical protein